jgi:DNA polymerase
MTTLSQIRAEAERCTDCPLYKHATQTVFGEGPARAQAGQILNRALTDADIERTKVYITNAVKHFKFELRGKRRIHSKPNAAEIKVCHQWVSRELAVIEPDVVVALGATAAQSLMGKAMPIGKNRSHELTWADGRRGLITVHPSFLLRIPDAESKEREYKAFVHDLKLAAKLTAK